RFTDVDDSLPTALAGPVVICAAPSEVFDAVPSTCATLAPLPMLDTDGPCSTEAVFVEALPIAVVPPALALASPPLAMSASW
ncbi:MAG: hypothetical protein J2P16_17255, partial [Mycobacterium sp.]|nr:hypothetical protein [Mycobacterium sp.]